MMSSYEFDQPLDLRLKALNLSLGTYQRHHTMISASNNIGSISSSNGSSNSSGSSSSSSSSCSISSSDRSSSSSSSNSVGGGCYCNSGNCPTIGGRSTCNNNKNSSRSNLTPNNNILTQTPYNQIHQQPLNSHSNILNINNQHHQLPQQFNSQNLAASPTNHQNQSHLRPTNIHCQPLNHHQPHPLSRLHPPPSHLQPQTGSLHNHHQQQQQQQSMAHVSPPPSHQQPPPPQQASPQHLYSHSPMPPIKSLSLSSHLMNSTFPSSSTPPSSTNHQQQFIHSQTSVICANPMASQDLTTQHQAINGVVGGGSDIPHQQLLKLGAVVSSQTNNNNNNATTNNNNNNGHYMHQQDQLNGSTNFNSNAHLQPNSVNQNQQPNTASPITRQHSLVSRYNCKPCGIVFSQPETLRAHQEGYCTKRDRAQTQVRSQSAVSPTAMQQQQQQQASSDSGNNK